MGQINTGRVILGGLVAGLVINIGETILNIPILGAESDAALQALGLEPFGGSVIAVFVAMGFLLGLLTVWLYAAMRPRFGPGPKTAVIAGLVVWVLGVVLASIGYGMLGLFPVRLLVIVAVWDLFERAYRRVGPVSTLIEWDDRIPDFDRLEAEAVQARKISEQIRETEWNDGSIDRRRPAAGDTAATAALD